MQQQQMSQNQQMNLQQPTMPNPPSVITTKDHLYITDMLSWNLLAMKKAHFYAQQCQDEEIKQALNRAGAMHKRHYEKILTQLQSHQQQQTQTPLQ